MAQLDRRDLLKTAVLAGAGLNAARAAARPLRIGFVGLGARGTALLDLALRFDGVEVPAVCDINASNLERAQKLVESRTHHRPEGYSRNETDFRRLSERNDLDLVLTAAPWRWRTSMCVAAMQAGKHAATEGPAAVTVEECWQLVETSEKTGRHCALIESDCYSPQSLMVLNMFRGGLLGEPLFAEAGFCQDLRADSARWNESGRNGNPDPTHAAGPVAWWMDINRGDAFSFLTSMSTKAGAMKEIVNTTLISTERGRTISLYYDTSTPRPPERLMRVQGSRGVYSGMLNKIFVDGRSNHKTGPDWLADSDWEDVAPYEKEYAHKLWTVHGEKAAASGNGGSGYLALYRLIKNLSDGHPPDIDVYDAATWSAIAPMSEASVAGHNRTVEFPNFTRSRWKTRPPLDPEALI